MALDIQSIRDEFPQLQVTSHDRPLIYLDSAATTLKPPCVADRIYQFYTKESANVHRGAHQISDQATRFYEEAREKVARFIGSTDSREIVFTRGTTESINLVARSYAGDHLQSGDEIILTEMEHHSNIVPWQLIAEEKELKIKVIPVDENGELIFSRFKELIGPRTKLLSLTHVSNSIGTLNPIKKFIAEAKKQDIVTVVDAAQSVSSQSIDVKDLNCDFLAFSGHKIFGPTGIGVLWGKREILNQMPPYQGGGSMIDQVTFEKTTFLETPQRFEAGTPHIAGAIGLGRALDFVRDLGLENIRSHEEDLVRFATDELSQIQGLRGIGDNPNRVNIVSFILEGVHHSDVSTLVDQQGIALRAGHHCTQPLMDRFGIPGTLRVAFSVYNSREDVVELIKAINKAKEFFI